MSASFSLLSYSKFSPLYNVMDEKFEVNNDLDFKERFVMNFGEVAKLENYSKITEWESSEEMYKNLNAEIEDEIEEMVLILSSLAYDFETDNLVKIKFDRYRKDILQLYSEDKLGLFLTTYLKKSFGASEEEIINYLYSLCLNKFEANLFSSKIKLSVIPDQISELIEVDSDFTSYSLLNHLYTTYIRDYCATNDIIILSMKEEDDDSEESVLLIEILKHN